MKDKKKTRGDGPDMKTWGFAAGAAAFLALLTVVLCLMGGVFKFQKGDAAATGEPSITTPAPVTTHSPMATVAPDATPRPTEEVTEKLWDITVIAGKGGSVAPGGLVQVVEGESVTLSVIPDEGYELSELKVDGANVDASASYTFTNVTASHSFYAVFRLVATVTPSPSPSPEIPSSPTDIG
jgi:hypothetical protein